ncbi:hypothetical protein KKC08_01400 [Patescibacteria group bacterium]|nr:hypothetical protein [Patescibacteria group bacterium]MCG2701888.1 hypothetical protein [Candidatus Parcubacteria bacterium]MBU4264898.1 hypothetical protein [Patescibacteria group bacterium]MBU4389924.1 hypothetical protein [Patescibacteria group bacterium]MBU4396809.1 hypothetical protein [Patescibacteria group bacterium]
MNKQNKQIITTISSFLVVLSILVPLKIYASLKTANVLGKTTTTQTQKRGSVPCSEIHQLQNQYCAQTQSQTQDQQKTESQTSTQNQQEQGDQNQTNQSEGKINTISFQNKCGTEEYRNANYRCTDGKQGTLGGPTSCESITTWEKQAEIKCQNY